MAKVGQSKTLVGDCWTITFKNADGRSLGHPDAAWTWGSFTGNFAELTEQIEAIGGTVELSDFRDETSDVKDICICVPCKSLANPSKSINWVFGPLNGTRTGILNKKWCDEVDYTEPRCFHARRLCVGRDNGLTPGSSSNTAGTRPDWIRFDWEFESKGIEINGELLGVGQIIGGTTGWTQQFTNNTTQEGKAGDDLTTWVPYFNSLGLDPTKYCAAFGVNSRPTWRYANHCTVDPCAKFGDWKLCRTDLPENIPAEETEYTIHPVLVESEIVKVWRYWKIQDGKKSLVYCQQNEDGTFADVEPPTWQPYRNATPVPIPADCYIPCDRKFEDPIVEGAASLCSTTLEDGCEIKPAVLDPDTFDVIEPAVAVTTNLLVAISICEDGSVKTFAYQVDDDGNATPYELPDPNLDGHFFGDCETLEAFPDPPPIDCRPEGEYTGRTFCLARKGKFVLIERQFDETVTGPQTVDVSSDLGLPAGSVLATLDTQLWTGGAGTIVATNRVSPATFSVSGSQPVCIRVQHGGSIPTDGAVDGMTSNDGVAYSFTGNITGDGTIGQSGNDYTVTSGTDNSQGAINWTSQTAATSATAFTTNQNRFNSVRFWVATFECIELREWVSDCGSIVAWYDGITPVSIEGEVESDCCSKCDEKLALLEDIKELLDCDECPELEVSATTNSDDQSTVNFPFTATSQFKDHSTNVSVTDPAGCFAANPDALIQLRYKVDHQAGPYDTHRAYFLISSHGTFVAQSASNTAGTVGNANIVIGYSTGETANQRNERWVKLEVRAEDLLNGITLSTGFFGGVGGATETIHFQSIEICGGLEICDC